MTDASTSPISSPLLSSIKTRIVKQTEILDCPKCQTKDSERRTKKTEDSESYTKKTEDVSDKLESHNTEFVYYSATLREIAPQITNEVDRHLIIPWIRKLFGPEYHGIRFRAKRNKYLLHLVLLLMNDEAWGIFRHLPPEGALQDPAEVAETEIGWVAEWEKDNMWQEVISTLPYDFSRMPCTIHQSIEGCEDDTEHGKQLDEEFRYLMYLTRPFCVLLRSANERIRAATWLQSLCTITPEACDAMKRVRNEYCIALLGYVHELRVAGPFSGAPYSPLPPLGDLVKMCSDRQPNLDPCGHEADEFLTCQPVPDEGAFCYLAITGELLDSTMEKVD